MVGYNVVEERSLPLVYFVAVLESIADENLVPLTCQDVLVSGDWLSGGDHEQL